MTKPWVDDSCLLLNLHVCFSQFSPFLALSCCVVVFSFVVLLLWWRCVLVLLLADLLNLKFFNVFFEDRGKGPGQPP